MVTLVVTVLTLPHIRSYCCYRKLQGRQWFQANNRNDRIGYFIALKVRFMVIFTFIAGVPSRYRRTGNDFQIPA